MAVNLMAVIYFREFLDRLNYAQNADTEICIMVAELETPKH